MSWIPYLYYERDFVPMTKWGKDHWSTLAYVETRIVDHKGRLNGDHMRVNSRLHSGYEGLLHNLREVTHIKEYPTILKGGVLLPDHDDWSCLEDMIESKLLTVEIILLDENCMTERYEARVQLTEKGRLIANKLREHKANGGNFSQFVFNESE